MGEYEDARAAYIRDTVAKFPPMTEQQINTVATLLRPEVRKWLAAREAERKRGEAGAEAGQ